MLRGSAASEFFGESAKFFKDSPNEKLIVREKWFLSRRKFFNILLVACLMV
jgi:hypothetical protein